MPTPTAIADAARNADEMIRSLTQPPQAGGRKDETDAETEAEPVASNTEADVPDTEPGDEVSNTEAEVSNTEPETEASNTEAQAQPAESAPQDDAERRAQLWEQRYRSLNGMIESRDRQIESLHQLLSNLQAAPQAPAQPPAPPAPVITDADKAEYGEDLIDLTRRVAQAELSGRETDYLRRIEELEAQVSGVSRQQASSAQDQFLGKLRTRIPDLDTVNQDPDFVRWLGRSPTRQRMFNEAVQSMDIDGTAFFFETWASPNGGGQQVQRSERAQAQPRQTDPRLERQVAPGKSRNVPTPAQRNEGTKRQWTRSAIVQFYKTLASHPPQDRDRIERDIALAQREGRVDFTK